MVKEIINKVKKIINNLTRPGENLSESVVRGGFWVFSLRIAQQLFNIVRLVIIARILTPKDFGLIGIALLTMATLETFSQTGFQQALIQKKEDIKSYLDSAWTILILRGFILFAILYLIAPYAATFFNAPEAKPIIQVIGFSILLQAFTNICVIYFQKELKFHKQFIYQLSGTLVDLIVAISFVLILKNVWALVLGLLAGNFVRFIISYLIHSYKPHFSLDLDKIKELFSFGRWILGSSILIFLLSQGDDIFVGNLLGATALGFYQLAYRISNMPATEITHVISQVTFPTYSKLQEDIPKLREAYLKVLQFTAFLSIPIAGLIFILAPDFTKIFLGEKWMPMVPAMQVLCIVGMIRSIAATIGPIFQASGKPHLQTKISSIQLLVLSGIIFPLTTKLGILGTSLAVMPAALVALWGNLWVMDIIKTSWKTLIKVLSSPLIATIIMILFVQTIKIIPWVNGLLQFLFLISIGIMVYLSTLKYGSKTFFTYDPINMTRELVSNIAGGGNRMHILFLTKGGYCTTSSRVRVFKYLPLLKKCGIHSKVIIVNLGSLVSTVTCITKILVYSLFSDVIFIQRVVSPKLVKLINRVNKKIIFDFDDAIFTKNPHNPKSPELGRERELQEIIRLSKAITVGNEYLKEYVLKYNDRVTVIPTAVDCDLFTLGPSKLGRKSKNSFVIGWVGRGEEHLPHLKLLFEPLENLGKKYNITFRIIGTMGSKRMQDYFKRAKNFKVELIDWVEPDEIVDVIRKFDVGVMPLTNDEFSKGKCGLKMLEYIAVGIPVVCSPVGVNADIIENGIDGFTASTNKEWAKKLEILIKDKDLRRKFSKRGRNKVLGKYSYQVNVEKLVEVFNQVKFN